MSLSFNDLLSRGFCFFFKWKVKARETHALLKKNGSVFLCRNQKMDHLQKV